MAGTVPEYVIDTVAASFVCWLSRENTTTCIIKRIMDFRRMWVCIWRTLTTEQFFFCKDSKLFQLSFMKYVFQRVTVLVTVVSLSHLSYTILAPADHRFPVPVQA